MASRGDFADFQNQYSSKQKGKDVEVEYSNRSGAPPSAWALA